MRGIKQGTCEGALNEGTIYNFGGFGHLDRSRLASRMNIRMRILATRPAFIESLIIVWLTLKTAGQTLMA